jgi:hypothetical protein
VLFRSKRANHSFGKKLGHKEGETETKGRPKIAPARRTCGVYLKRPDDHHRKNRKIKRQQERKEGKAFDPRLKERSGEQKTAENAGGDKSEEKQTQKISNELIRGMSTSI